MCMEDERIGKASSREESYPVVNSAATPVLPQNMDRHSLMISNIGANPVYLFFGNAGAAPVGMLLPINSTPQRWNRAEYGDVVTGGLFAACGGVLTSQLAIWATYLNEDAV